MHRLQCGNLNAARTVDGPWMDEEEEEDEKEQEDEEGERKMSTTDINLTTCNTLLQHTGNLLATGKK